MHRRRLFCPIGTLLLFCLWPLTASADLTVQRAAFVAADQALTLGNRLLFTQSQTLLASYPLYPYLRYRDLTGRLDTLPATEVQSFLHDYATTPLA